jgi:hypothetical protein
LRLLEIEVLKLVLKNQQVTDVGLFSLVDVDAMYGIEINEFPSLIAEVALWLMDHQMNLKLSEEFGQYFIRLPLTKSAKIVNANALRIDWADVIKPEDCSYILGNPPFVGKQYQTAEQKADIEIITGGIKNGGTLDYVCCWYVKGAKYISGTNTICAFVSTNSITQGEQACVLWPHLFQKLKISIHFAHRTFTWKSEARGKAHVHVVIIGFGCVEPHKKVLVDYDENEDHPTTTFPRNISPYLVAGKNSTVSKNRTPINRGKPIVFGNMPNDGGFLLLTEDEKSTLIKIEPDVAKWIRPLMGSEEMINNLRRYCLWLIDLAPDQLRNMPTVLARVEKVKTKRLSSPRATTRGLASTPSLFGEIRQPQRDYLAIPEVSSERRKFIPIGWLGSDVIATNKIYTMEDASLYDFGVLTSSLHNSWMRTVCGRLKSDYQYSAGIVYNNYPWPENPTDKQKANVEAKAQAVLDARAKYPDSSLADLYDPLTMPPDLVKSHEQLDRAVEQCYRSKPFESDRERVEYLFQLYEQLTAPLTAQADKPKRTRKKKTDDTE